MQRFLYEVALMSKIRRGIKCTRSGAHLICTV